MKKESTHKFRVLVADDDEKILDLYREVLDQADVTEPCNSEFDYIGAELFKDKNQEKRSAPAELSYSLTVCRQANEAVEAVRCNVELTQLVAALSVKRMKSPQEWKEPHLYIIRKIFPFLKKNRPKRWRP